MELRRYSKLVGLSPVRRSNLLKEIVQDFYSDNIGSVTKLENTKSRPYDFYDNKNCLRIQVRSAMLSYDPKYGRNRWKLLFQNIKPSFDKLVLVGIFP